MGAAGSGRKSSRQVAEFCQKLNLTELLQGRINFDVSGLLHLVTKDSTGRVLYTAWIETRKEGDGLNWFIKDTKQWVTLNSMPLHFGGSRWWFGCPGCERRCRILYKPAGATVYKCRICHHLRYADKSAASFGGMARLVGIDAGKLKLAFDSEMRRNRRPFVRKRDRRADYRPHRLTLLRTTENYRF